MAQNFPLKGIFLGGGGSEGGDNHNILLTQIDLKWTKPPPTSFLHGLMAHHISSILHFSCGHFITKHLASHGCLWHSALWIHLFYLPSLFESLPLSSRSMGCALGNEESAHWMSSPFIVSLKTLKESGLGAFWLILAD